PNARRPKIYLRNLRECLLFLDQLTRYRATNDDVRPTEQPVPHQCARESRFQWPRHKQQSPVEASPAHTQTHQPCRIVYATHEAYDARPADTAHHCTRTPPRAGARAHPNARGSDGFYRYAISHVPTRMRASQLRE